MQTYLGFSQEDKSVPPSISSHSFTMLDDNFDVIISPEFTTELPKDLLTKVYFRVVTVPKDKDSDITHIEYADAFLVEDSTIIVKDIKHVHNGRSVVSFTPRSGKYYTLHVKKSKTDQKYKEFKLPIVNETMKLTLQVDKSSFRFSDKTLTTNILTSAGFKTQEVTVTLANKQNVVFN